ncbi:MAG: H4MPT-linked C1 transfer pathway protein [Methanobacterium sp.]|uniref:hydantoinase/oxoprolinase family protein n=1 Tax=Methanobacterium sp. TaxID=2164 RepID=UPI003D66298C|nr:H4MPT-linked C1 transfer pathway protein [Methanobacterium sp.]
MKIAGFDIGGANTDLAVVEFNDHGDIIDIKTDFKYFPMWLEKDKLGNALIDLIGDDINDLDAVGICMTAELVDAYKTKKEGVLDISRKSNESFNVPVGFIGLNGVLKYKDVIKNPEDVAAANWIATSKIASKMEPNSIMIDTGSTTTDIIPIKNGSECTKGRSDLERLKTGELVYSGTLRTNVATIVRKVPLGDEFIRVSSELFAITADIHMVLGNIKKEEYTCSTPDGAGKSKEECMRRIARVICGDMDMLTPDNICEIAAFIYQKQIERIAEALIEVSKREKIEKVVTTGLGMDIIGAKAAEMAEINFEGMDKIITKEECVVAPAIGTALMMEQFMRKDEI